MNIKRSIATAGISLLTLCAALTAPVAKATTFFGPTSYLSFEDSPFRGKSFSYFHLEDFEDGLLNTPGVNASRGQVWNGIGIYQDSVDADDGTIDGFGINGSSFGAVEIPDGLTFTFDRNVLGSLPTHVGLVWTDAHTSEPLGYGYGWLTFEAVDGLGASLGVIGHTLVGDGTTIGITGEDRFFGVANESGISAIKITMPNVIAGISIDRLQYGLAKSASNQVSVTEPTSTLGGLLVLFYY